MIPQRVSQDVGARILSKTQTKCYLFGESGSYRDKYVLVEHLTEKKMLPKKGYVKEKADFWSRIIAAQLLMS